MEDFKSDIWSDKEIFLTIGDSIFRSNLDKTKQANMSNMCDYRICISEMVNSSDFFPKVYMLCFQHQHGHSTPSAILVPGYLIPSSGHFGHLEHVHACQQKSYIQNNIYICIYICVIYIHAYAYKIL